MSGRKNKRDRKIILSQLESEHREGSLMKQIGSENFKFPIKQISHLEYQKVMSKRWREEVYI